MLETEKEETHPHLQLLSNFWSLFLFLLPQVVRGPPVQLNLAFHGHVLIVDGYGGLGHRHDTSSTSKRAASKSIYLPFPSVRHFRPSLSLGQTQQYGLEDVYALSIRLLR